MGINGASLGSIVQDLIENYPLVVSYPHQRNIETNVM